LLDEDENQTPKIKGPPVNKLYKYYGQKNPTVITIHTMNAGLHASVSCSKKYILLQKKTISPT